MPNSMLLVYTVQPVEIGMVNIPQYRYLVHYCLPSPWILILKV